jgi:hypothetical protein
VIVVVSIALSGIGLFREDAHGDFFTGQVGAGQLEGLGDVGVLDVNDGVRRRQENVTFLVREVGPVNRIRRWTAVRLGSRSPTVLGCPRTPLCR